MSEASSHKPVPALPSSSVARATGKSSPPQPTDGQTVISSSPPAPDLDFQPQAPLESASQWEGEQLGQFVLQKFIGGGGMGIVFRALDTTLDREVAVKVLSRDQSADEEMLRRFRNEAQSAARLSHDNIARVFYVGEDRGVHYIVFEFIEGVNIRDLVEAHGPLPLEEAVSYTYQIAQALEHASQRSVIHRDIKPSNVLVTPDGKAKLVDMGLARLNQIAAVNADLTASGVTLGTFDYISPEQARDPRSADVRSDLYSLGCSFFFMLTGRPPFPDGTVLQKLLQHQGDLPPDPRTFRPELPPEVTHILARLLAKNPAQRYQQPAELTADLVSLGELLGIQLASPGGTRVAPRRRYPLGRWQHHLPWIITVAALFLVVMALDLYWSPRASDTAGVPSPVPPQMPADDSSAIVPAPLEPPVVPKEFDPLSSDPLAPPSEEAGDRGADSGPPISPEVQTPEAANAGGSFDEILKLPEKLLQQALNAGAKKSNAPSSSGTGPREAGTDDADRSLDDSTPGAPAISRSVDEHVLVVSDEPGQGNYLSLHAACSEAADGDTIELRYNGRRAAERPIEISNVNLTIRAGQGFRPTVVFEPKLENPFKNPPAMVSVAGGTLAASDVNWEFVLPRDVPPHCALFETRGCDLLEFRRCTLSIEGQTAYHSRVAFFDIKAPPGAKSMNMDTSSTDDHVVTVNLHDCVARGEATFLRDDEMQSVRLKWENGLLATSDRLFVAGGTSLQPRHDVRAELTLRHVTAMVASGLVLLTNSQEAPYQLLTQIRCDDCIIAARDRPPLVEQRGSDSIAQYQTRFQWSGENNYFDGFDVFWQIMNSAGQSGSKQLDFAEWHQLWHGPGGDQADGQAAVMWLGLPSEARPFHTHTPLDYALADQSAVGAAASAIDRAGFRPLDLPPVPSQPPAAESGLESGN